VLINYLVFTVKDEYAAVLRDITSAALTPAPSDSKSQRANASVQTLSTGNMSSTCHTGLLKEGLGGIHVHTTCKIVLFGKFSGKARRA